jgi:hypothetical protein
MDMTDLQPTLVDLLVSHGLLPREFLPQIGINSNVRTRCGNLPASAGACQTSERAGTIPYLQVREKGSSMPSNDWAARHPELVHWLHQAEDELVGYAPIDAFPTPAAVFPEPLLPFFVVIAPGVAWQGRCRHQWTSMDCLYSHADIDTLRTFFAQVHGRQDTFLFHDCVCRFANEQLVIRQHTTVAYRLDPIRIVSLTY